MKIADDCVVTIAYELTDQNGTTIEDVDEDSALSYLHGHGNIVPGLEEELEGLESGDSFEVTVPPERGYGQRAEELVNTVSRDTFPEDEELEVGMAFEATRSHGDGEEATQVLFITDVGEDEVEVDANHPMAGRTLSFDGSIVDVREATDQEIAAKRPMEQ